MPWQENIAEEMKVKFRFGCMQGVGSSECKTQNSFGSAGCRI